MIANSQQHSLHFKKEMLGRNWSKTKRNNSFILGKKLFELFILKQFKLIADNLKL